MMATKHGLDAFLVAVQAGDDEAAERASHFLSAVDEDRLLELLASPDQDLRWWALRGLALCGSVQSVKHVVLCLADDSAEIRTAAAMTLSHLHRRQGSLTGATYSAMARLLADADGTVRQVTADALAQCGDDAVSALAAVLAGTHDGARSRAAYALRRIATMPSALVLYEYLNDPNYLVRTYACEGLDEMGLLDNVLVAL